MYSNYSTINDDEVYITNSQAHKRTQNPIMLTCVGTATVSNMLDTYTSTNVRLIREIF